MGIDVDKKTIENLKDTIDALVQQGSELSKNLSVDECYNMMKRLILEGVDKALLNTEDGADSNLTDEESIAKRNNLVEFVREYFEEKFSESLAMEWDKSKGGV